MKICCVGYRDWAIEIYDKLDYAGFNTLIMKEYDEEKIREYNPTYILFYGWSDIIDEKIINDFDKPVINIENTRKAASIISSRFHDNPSNDLTIIGITGTNGKTTTAYLLKQCLDCAGF